MVNCPGTNASTLNMEHTHNEHKACCKSNNNVGVRQSLSEMDFERGIWYAALYNDLDRVKTLLRKGVSVNAEDSAGYTALHYAARNGHHEMCKLLLENNATTNAQTRSGRATPLHRAAMQGHTNIVELLLKFDANPNLQDADGYTALHQALLSRSESVCRILIPRTNLTLVPKNKHNIEQWTKEHCSSILPFLLTYTNKQLRVTGE